MRLSNALGEIKCDTILCWRALSMSRDEAFMHLGKNYTLNSTESFVSYLKTLH